MFSWGSEAFTIPHLGGRVWQELAAATVQEDIVKYTLKPGSPAPETGEYQPVNKNGAPSGVRRQFIQGMPLGELPDGHRWRLVVILVRLS